VLTSWGATLTLKEGLIVDAPPVLIHLAKTMTLTLKVDLFVDAYLIIVHLALRVTVTLKIGLIIDVPEVIPTGFLKSQEMTVTVEGDQCLIIKVSFISAKTDHPIGQISATIMDHVVSGFIVVDQIVMSPISEHFVHKS
jgi:hypothetical protein